MNRTYPTQKRIAGTKPDLYKWADRKNAAPYARRAPVKQQYAESKPQGIEVCGKALISVVAAMLVFILSFWLGLFVRNEELRTSASDMQTEIKILNAEIETLQFLVSSASADDLIKSQAQEQLGMILPSEERVYVLKGIRTNTMESAQTAEARVGGR